jgi:SWI/SNF-related matrix-associated actin-dependent regulator of chromatin subfamily B protein 1
LSGEFRYAPAAPFLSAISGSNRHPYSTAIAHSIREQVDVFTKSLCILGHVQGVPVPDDDLRREFLPSLFEPFRADAADFTPLLNQLTPDEVERNDKEREREVRRKRRQTKGRGVTLPDRDFVKTHRTLVPKPSTVPIHSYQDQRGDIIYPMPEMSYPYPVVLPTPTEKPPNLETVASSPLKLVPAKGTVIVPTGPDPVRPGGSRLKRLKQNGDGSFVADAPSGSVTPAEGSPFPGVAVEELPSKKVGVSKAKKVIPVIKVNLEELGLHEHIINGAWHCANW